MRNDPMDREHDVPDAALDALLRAHARPVPATPLTDLEARILAQAAFPLAQRRRNARVSIADNLAAWVRVALPLAAAAAIAAAVFMPRAEPVLLADVELRDSDPAALLSALEADGSSGLAHHVIGSDVVNSGGAIDVEPR